ncbi:MAG: hypothetical protein HY300_07730 [Verrucomicrobia bacterium]|nr:hypothetical protein [Verrucomicrobiota bacterium]
MKTTLRRTLVVCATAGALIAGCTPQITQSQPATAPPPVVNTPDPAVVTTPAVPRRIPPQPVSLSPGVAEVITLAQGGVEESVIKAHMARSANAFSPTVDELIYLNDIGVSAQLVSVLIQQNTQMRGQIVAMTPVVQPASAQPNPPGAQPAPAQPQPPAAQVQPEQPVQQTVVAAPVQQVVVVPAQAPVQVTYFYQSLAPYGSWVEVPSYGWCWQPTVAISSPRWRPYCDRGRWIYTSCGWYWQSDYSWGWAPFHYGRWALDTQIGWVWVPDSTWGPAWVTWRYSDAYCGWAPLPPECVFLPSRGLCHRGVSVGVGFDFGFSLNYFSFVAWDRFCDRNPFYYLAPAVQVRNIYNQTTIINNYSTANNTVINNGVPAHRVAALARTQLQPVLIKDAPASSGTVVKPDRLEKNGSQLVIYRPQLPAISAGQQASLRTPSARPVALAGTPSANAPAASLAANTSTTATGTTASVQTTPTLRQVLPPRQTGAATVTPAVTTSSATLTPAPSATTSSSATGGSASTAPALTPAPHPVFQQPVHPTLLHPVGSSNNSAGTVVKPNSPVKLLAPSASATVTGSAALPASVPTVTTTIGPTHPAQNIAPVLVAPASGPSHALQPTFTPAHPAVTAPPQQAVTPAPHVIAHSYIPPQRTVVAPPAAPYSSPAPSFTPAPHSTPSSGGGSPAPSNTPSQSSGGSRSDSDKKRP